MSRATTYNSLEARSREVERIDLCRRRYWLNHASIAINGRRLPHEIAPGIFAVIEREWTSGDHIELELPTTMRTEPLDTDHLQTVALSCGPLVLFPVTDRPLLATRADLLAATKTDKRSWELESAGSSIQLLPFTEIAEERYSTYFNLL